MKTVLSQNNQLPKQRDTGMRGGVAAWEHAIYAAKEYKRMLLSGNMGWWGKVALRGELRRVLREQLRGALHGGVLGVEIAEWLEHNGMADKWF